MKIQPVDHIENADYYKGIRIPADGFVNVNEIVNRIRYLRNAGLSDAEINTGVNVHDIQEDQRCGYADDLQGQ